MTDSKNRSEWVPPDEEEQELIKGLLKEMARRLRPDLHPDPDAPAMEVGRNDPCPCGSGRKFKRCHGSGEAGS